MTCSRMARSRATSAKKRHRSARPGDGSATASVSATVSAGKMFTSWKLRAMPSRGQPHGAHARHVPRLETYGAAVGVT